MPDSDFVKAIKKSVQDHTWNMYNDGYCPDCGMRDKPGYLQDQEMHEILFGKGQVCPK